MASPWFMAGGVYNDSLLQIPPLDKEKRHPSISVPWDELCSWIVNRGYHEHRHWMDDFLLHWQVAVQCLSSMSGMAVGPERSETRGQ
jgi:hypothetical protein